MKTGKQKLSSEKRKLVDGLFASVCDVMKDLHQGAVVASTLKAMENIDAFWECYDAVSEVIHVIV